MHPIQGVRKRWGILVSDSSTKEQAIVSAKERAMMSAKEQSIFKKDQLRTSLPVLVRTQLPALLRTSRFRECGTRYRPRERAKWPAHCPSQPLLMIFGQLNRFLRRRFPKTRRFLRRCYSSTHRTNLALR